MPKRFWIQSAKLKEGTLRAQMRNKYGKRAFTDRGTIKCDYLAKAAKQGGKLGKRARLAKTLRKLR